MKSQMLIIIAAVAASLATAGCGGGGKPAATVEGTPTPASAASPKASAAALRLVVRGGPLGTMADTSVQTSPDTSCSIVYTHPSGKASTARGLDPKVAGADGIVSWSWRIDPGTLLGVGQVAVICGADRAAAPIVIGPAPVPVGDSKLAVMGGAAGTVASVTMHGSPGAACSILYTHPSGQASVAQGLEPRTAGADGAVSWAWVISGGTVPGTGTVAVTCGSDQASAPIVIGPAKSP